MDKRFASLAVQATDVNLTHKLETHWAILGGVKLVHSYHDVVQGSCLTGARRDGKDMFTKTPYEAKRVLNLKKTGRDRY